MWKTGLALLCAVAATPSLALFTTGDALVIGNARYGAQTTGFGPAEVRAVAQALRLRGQEVEALANGGAGPMAQAFDAFVATITEGEAPLIVVLSGVFAHGDDGIYLLPAGAGQDEAEGLSLSAVLRVLAQSPRRAFLILGEAAGGPPGLGELDIPQGVTVIRGPADQVAQFAAREMAQPGARVAKTAGFYDLRIDGHRSEDLVVLDHTEVRPPTEAEQAAARDRARQVDDMAWKRAREAGNSKAYRAYLDSFPKGHHAVAAQGQIAEIALGLDLPARKSIQRNLRSLGYDTQGIDGIFGPATRRAITTWQERTGAGLTGFLDTSQIAQLAKQAAVATPRAAAQLRQGRTVSAQEAAIWNRARGEAGLRNYLGQYPRGAYAQRARVLLSNIQRGVDR